MLPDTEHRGRMSFFDDFERPPPPEKPVEYEPPLWHEPPSRHLAALVGDRRVLARADGAAVVLIHVDVFRPAARFGCA